MTAPALQIRESTSGDFATIMDVETRAFGYDKEAGLVAALLADPTAVPTVSLLAFDREEPVGHILFTRAFLDGLDDQPMIHVLAPLAVTPEYQRRGVGGQLIDAGIRMLKERGSHLVFVLGHKEYYPRHGFRPDAGAQGYPAPYPIPDEVADCWMVQPVSDRGFGVGQGKVRCCDELNKPQHWRDDEADR
ncbi:MULTISPECIES: GNAT family N-acetyltransferase [unclassified Streptomyces]|uniref:GNAT family N-acetyltransferase n=1 Tax=unclassified Streptomyces TaxID=2593676 RepID=UPI00093898EA|nr:N-acetyltransferase [Streptomyces sp. CB02058]OKI92250.1 acetyltransferase [Streptomyces sp. CB02058]